MLCNNNASCSLPQQCQSPYFIFTLFALLKSLLVKYSHSHPPYLLHNLHSLTAFIPSLPSFSPLQTQEYPKEKKQIVRLGRLGLQFTGGTNSMLVTSLKSLHSCCSFPRHLHERDQRPVLEDLPRAFGPPPDLTLGWSPGPLHE